MEVSGRSPARTGREACWAAIASALALLCACSTIPPRLVLTDIAVSEHGFDPGGEFCRDFDMSPRQVAAFFRRAQTVSQAELHSGFDYLPCYVRGSAMLGDAPATWEIRAGGTARIIGLHAEPKAYGCRDCEDLLRPGP